MKIYTISIPYARKCGIDKLPGYIDITIGSGSKVFAPTWNMVHSVKNGDMSEDGYTKLYTGLMYESMKNSPDIWYQLTHIDTVYLACYCKPNSFCHRYILADILVEKYQAEYLGEYTHESVIDRVLSRIDPNKPMF